MTNYEIIPFDMTVSQKSETQHGLVATGDFSEAKVALERVKVDCKILDMISEVTVYQQYYNSNNYDVEAKYVRIFLEFSDFNF